jgi:predicted HNH restriction endonuclease
MDEICATQQQPKPKETMPSAFTHYWSESTVNLDAEGEPFNHTAGNRFVRSGVTTGDRVFGVTIRRGIPTLIGALTLSRPPITYEEACDLLPYDPWVAADHLIGDSASSSTTSYSRTIPFDVLRRLRFISASGETALKFVSDTRLDQQTFRGVRKLTPESAAELEALIGPNAVHHSLPLDSSSGEVSLYPDEVEADDTWLEGSVTQVLVNRYERDPAARKACLEEHGCICVVCDIDFAEWYGDRGAGFIHVHHVTPISQLGADYRINPVTDLVPVCPNCHAMLHRNPPVSVKQLRRIYSHHLEQLSSQQEG